jgi:electron transfer flavoprotein beta subunit
MMQVVALIHHSRDLVAARLAKRLGEVTAVAVAPEEPQVLSALSATGAERTLRLWDEALEGVDYLGTALALAGAVRALGKVQVVVCADGGTAAVGPAVAERLGWPHLGRVVDAAVENGRLVAKRRIGNSMRKLAAAPPAVLCVSEEPMGPLTAAAGDLKLETWSLADAALTAAELTYRRSFRPQPAEGPTGEARRFANIDELVARLRADGLVGR